MWISPFTTIRSRDSGLVLSNLLVGQEIALDHTNFNDFIEAGILAEKVQRAHQLQLNFERLERQFQRSKPTIGYIETTSRCPFTCIMCPKSENQLNRKQAVMDMALFEKILRQLKHQKIITLHLFGDPLMDPFFYQRLQLADQLGLGTVFSTNIPMFKGKNIGRLFELPIEQLIVSVDSLDPKTYTAIRQSPANRADSHAATLKPFLEFLTRFKSEPHRIKNLTLRAVNLRMSQSDIQSIGELADHDSRIHLDIKPYIDFPKTGKPELGGETFSSLDEPVFLYQTMGQKLPFKCTKPWKAGELAVTSDGQVLPCCLCFNGPYSLGSLETHSLDELYFSPSYADFRRKIYFSQLDPQWLCSSCTSDQVKIKVNEEHALKIENFWSRTQA